MPLNLMEIDQAVARNRAGEMQNQISLQNLLKSQRDMQRETDTDNAFRDSYDPTANKYDNNKLGALLSKSNPTQGYQFQQDMAAKQAEQAKATQAQKTQELDYAVKAADYNRNEFSRVARDGSNWAQTRAKLIQAGTASEQDLPEQFDPQLVQGLTMDADSFVKQNAPKEQQIAFTPSGVAYDAKNPQGIQLGGNYTKPLEPTKPDYNKPFLPDGTPNTAFQDYEKDKKDQVKLRNIPAAISTAITSNKQSLAALDAAIALHEGKDVTRGDNTMIGDNAATGWKGLLPPIMLNRIDPKGTDARAQTADIGSLIIHDRSGAAVTASETPRLMPFIPNATDDNSTIIKKLKRLRSEAQLEDELLNNQYNKDSGYNVPDQNKLKDSPPSGAKTMTMRDVEATAKKSGKTTKQVMDAAKNKGYTIK